MKTEFGIRLPVSGPLASASNIIRIGEVADELGFDAITTHDHVSHSYNERYHNSGGISELVDEADKKGLPVTNFYETIASLSVLAGKTRKVKLIPCCSVLPWRHPVLFAKQITTIHELSNGRFVCCVCIGNTRSDFRAMNVPFELRGKILNEYLQVLQMILSDRKQVSFKGDFIEFPLSEFYPKPSKKIPIWIGGSFIEPVFERLLKYGDGFLPTGGFEAYQNGISRLNSYFRAHGRSMSQLQVGTQTFMCLMKDGEAAREKSRRTIESFFSGTEWDRPDPNNPARPVREAQMAGTVEGALVGSPNEVIKKVEKFNEVGVNFFDIRLVNDSVDTVIEMLRLFSREVMPSFNH
jgi:alkanesulfonate monooxygenase SsuD/methylene tetrahydromethanopterin reductase-like flavin-dependent oxidoreductase (luciferase family)